mmetsp:Transcript_831/g.2446  ORF Transcript_831/g.2446 Transcript_831/m.2446 type:complete len:240 (+) Transcript_831:2100-2819(+)
MLVKNVFQLPTQKLVHVHPLLRDKVVHGVGPPNFKLLAYVLLHVHVASRHRNQRGQPRVLECKSLLGGFPDVVLRKAQDNFLEVRNRRRFKLPPDSPHGVATEPLADFLPPRDVVSITIVTRSSRIYLGEDASEEPPYSQDVDPVNIVILLKQLHRIDVQVAHALHVLIRHVQDLPLQGFARHPRDGGKKVAFHIPAVSLLRFWRVLHVDLKVLCANPLRSISTFRSRAAQYAPRGSLL